MRCFSEIERACKRLLCLLVFMISFVEKFSYVLPHILGVSKLIKRFNRKCCNYKYYTYDLYFCDYSSSEMFYWSVWFLILQVIEGQLWFPKSKQWYVTASSVSLMLLIKKTFENILLLEISPASSLIRAEFIQI